MIESPVLYKPSSRVVFPTSIKTIVTVPALASLSAIQAFLESEVAEPFFQDHQSTLLFLEDGTEGKQVRDLITWYAHQHTWSALASPAYGRYRSEVFRQISTELTVLQIDLSSILSEMFDPATSPLRNFGRTIFSWQRSFQGFPGFVRPPCG